MSGRIDPRLHARCNGPAIVTWTNVPQFRVHSMIMDCLWQAHHPKSAVDNTVRLGGVRAAMRRDPGHPRVLDTYLFTQQREFLPHLIQFGLKFEPSLTAVGGPAAHIGKRILRQRNDVKHSRTNATSPVSWQCHAANRPSGGHAAFSEPSFLEHVGE